jgi:hypothetical protein
MTGIRHERVVGAQGRMQAHRQVLCVDGGPAKDVCSSNGNVVARSSIINGTSIMNNDA